MGKAATVVRTTYNILLTRMLKMSLFCPLFALLSLALLLPSSTAAARSGRATISDLCEKCEYCKIDKDCTGCQQCASCENRKQEGCRFCRKKETVEKCVERCTKGCGICAGKDGDGLDSCKNKK